MAKHINITDDIKNKIIDFTHGDDKYWKYKFKNVMDELISIPTGIPWCEFLWGGYANHRGCCDYCDSFEVYPYINDRDHKFFGYEWENLPFKIQEHIIRRHSSNKKIFLN